jgi:hypothetical protein
MRIFALVSTFALLIAGCAATCPPPLPATSPTILHWSCPAYLHPRTADARSVSVTNQANGNVSILFTRGGIDLQSRSTQLADEWSAFLSFDTESNSTKSIPVRCHIRGHVTKSAGSRVNALVDVAGAGFVLEFPAGAATDEAIEKELTLEIPAAPHRQLPVMLMASGSRRSTDDGILLQFDSIDCSATLPDHP